MIEIECVTFFIKRILMAKSRWLKAILRFLLIGDGINGVGNGRNFVTNAV
jgi:hypothetical protein